MASENNTQPLSWPEVFGIDVQAANLLLNQGHRYIDVRDEEDYKKGHVVNAIHIPYYLGHTPEGRVKNPEFIDQVLNVFGKEDHFVVGCGTGNRSVLATTDLRDAEFNYAYNMLGGYRDWAAKGFPVDKPDPIEP